MSGAPGHASSGNRAPQSSGHRPSDADFVFHYDRVLGEGSFSTVLVATELKTGREWAVKTMLIKQLVRDKMQDYAFRERNALNLLSERPWDPSDLARHASFSSSSSSSSKTRWPSIAEEEEAGEEEEEEQQKRRRRGSNREENRRRRRHPFFVELHSSFKSSQRLFFVLTYARNGEILEHLKKAGKFSLPVTRFYVAEVTSALRHLHKIGVIHRDLKPENLLLGDDMHLLVADFGSCKILHPSAANSSNASNHSAKANPAGSQQRVSPTRCVQYSTSNQPNTATSSGETRQSSSEAQSRLSRKGSSNSTRSQLRPRAASFVGSPQYVSPEMLQGRPEEKGSDLWALGCILYHFVAGTFPFKGTTQYAIFQKIQALDFAFPTDFDAVAKDLCQKLIVTDPAMRLGAGDAGFPALLRHQFFDSIEWETLHLQTPPLLPREEGDVGAAVQEPPKGKTGFSEEDFARSVMDKLGGGDDDDDDDDEDDEGQFEMVVSKRRRSGAEPRPIKAAPVDDGQAQSPPSSSGKSITNYLAPESMTTGSFSKLPSTTAWTAASMVPLIMDLLDLSLEDKKVRRLKQERENDYHRFVEGHLILKSGILEKKRHAHYPTRRRMFLLTDGPRLYYVDPDKKELKGQVPWSSTMKTKYLNFKKFEIRTPNRTYDLLDPSGGAIDWCQCLDAVREKFFKTTTGLPASTSSQETKKS